MSQPILNATEQKCHNENHLNWKEKLECLHKNKQHPCLVYLCVCVCVCDGVCERSPTFQVLPVSDACTFTEPVLIPATNTVSPWRPLATQVKEIVTQYR